MNNVEVSESIFIQQDNSRWGLDSIVAELSQARNEWRDNHSVGHYQDKRLLPSKENISVVVNNLLKILYPMRLGVSSIRKESEDYYVGYLLSETLDRLTEEAQLELRHGVNLARQSGASPQHEESDEARAIHLIRQFSSQLPSIRRQLDIDILAAWQGDPSAKSVDEVLLCYPGVYAVIHYRIAHQLYRLGLPLLARIVSEKAHGESGIDIHPGAQIDVGIFIDHGTGVVIGETAIIGKRVRIYQAVTLGAKRFLVDESGVLQKSYPRHPIIEDDVVIYAGATLLGRITVGAGSSIGGNVWLTSDVPPGSNIRQATLLQTRYQDGDGI
ncbi:serine O-acetyltransferase EpsC [Brenneria populi subsp. brevivirga]|uniref:serine O-acetyltransferase EpsC n=1 Tax=Brenneria populi TaxID=1505588 RepID=UPI002E18CEE8|nr:serine O-acetyltransferase EpsC [Brenneria populi subsp. brevivirga]